MIPTNEKIKAFAENEGVIALHLGLLKVGHEKGASPHEIMKRIIASVLLQFHGIPPNPELN